MGVEPRTKGGKVRYLWGTWLPPDFVAVYWPLLALAIHDLWVYWDNVRWYRVYYQCVYWNSEICAP